MSSQIVPQIVEPVCHPSVPAETCDAYEASYLRVRAALEAVPDEQLESFNVNVPSAVTTVQAAVPALRTLREALVQNLPRFDIASLDALPDYANALAHLQSEKLRSTKASPELSTAYESALKFREIFRDAGKLLAKLGLVDGKLYESTGSDTGFRNVGYELKALCAELAALPPEVASRTPITADQIARGKTVALMLLDGVAAKEQRSLDSDTVAKQRQRAFTLMNRAYEEVRRSVIYLRWYEGDADDFAPSLFAGRGPTGPGKKSTADAPVVPPPADAAVVSGPDASPANPASGTARPSVAVATQPKGDPLFTPASDEPFVTP